MHPQRRQRDHRAGSRNEVSQRLCRPAHIGVVVCVSPDCDRLHQSRVFVDDQERGLVDTGPSDLRPGPGIGERRRVGESSGARTVDSSRPQRQPCDRYSGARPVPLRARQFLVANPAAGRSFRSCRVRDRRVPVACIERGPVASRRELRGDRQRQRGVRGRDEYGRRTQRNAHDRGVAARRSTDRTRGVPCPFAPGSVTTASGTTASTTTTASIAANACAAHARHGTGDDAHRLPG
jgi:hypothetical protein